MAAEGQEVVRIRNCLCSWVVEGGPLEGEGTEVDVIYGVPSERAGYVALENSSFRREKDVISPECLETVESGNAMAVMCLLGDGKAYSGLCLRGQVG